MHIFSELLVPTIFVNVALLGVLFGYSLRVLLGAFSSTRKTERCFPLGTSADDPGIPHPCVVILEDSCQF